MNRIEIVGFTKSLKALVKNKLYDDVEEVLDAVLEEAQLAKKNESKSKDD
jgi:mRNA-degrading endonuclease YafQ of YafQ-DinJ toxin-antitoxin module